VSEVSPGHLKFKFQRLLKKFFLLAPKATTLWSALYNGVIFETQVSLSPEQSTLATKKYEATTLDKTKHPLLCIGVSSQEMNLLI
jgi:hypothetical protein